MNQSRSQHQPEHKSEPFRPIIGAMHCHDVLFAHWPLPPEKIRPLIPTELQLDTHDGQAWFGVVAMRITGMRPRFMPSFLGLRYSAVNVRTYVRHSGKPGVWFFSLDIDSRLSLLAARTWYGLPYYKAHFELRKQGQVHHFDCTRTHRGASEARLRFDYTPVGDVFRSEPGSLTHWLTERYRLSTVSPQGKLGFGDIHHEPWPLQEAEATFQINTMGNQIGLKLPLDATLLHYSREREMLIQSMDFSEQSQPKLAL
ncbi:YqjF family protein [Desulfonatronum parangueonense]